MQNFNDFFSWSCNTLSLIDFKPIEEKKELKDFILFVLQILYLFQDNWPFNLKINILCRRSLAYAYLLNVCASMQDSILFWTLTKPNIACFPA